MINLYNYHNKISPSCKSYGCKIHDYFINKYTCMVDWTVLMGFKLSMAKNKSGLGVGQSHPLKRAAFCFFFQDSLHSKGCKRTTFFFLNNTNN
jgi:hypothetical protein